VPIRRAEGGGLVGVWAPAALALGVFLFWSARLFDAELGSRSVRQLARVAPLEFSGAPSVSVVVAARNEADAVARGVGSLLRMAYPRLEVIAVDDRSTDGTGAILAEMAAREPRLRVQRVERLPEGWLGKNRALAIGAAAASGEWLLFVDADVVLDHSAVGRAVGYAAARGLDHLTVLPEVIAHGLALRAFVAYIAFLLAGTSRPWRVRDPHRHDFIGIGAFNLVRRSAYVASGGHAAIRLRPDDDMRLAQRVKRVGGRSDVVLGRGLVAVEWQPSLRAALGSLEKTAFARMGYRISVMAGGLLVLAGAGLLPFVGAFAFGGWERWAFIAAGIISVLLYAHAGRAVTDFPTGCALLLPVVQICWTYAQARAGLRVVRRGGIMWRDTFYPLRMLRGG
jgi:glycosyltransferase involved in cell wall biosynthesis